MKAKARPILLTVAAIALAGVAVVAIWRPAGDTAGLVVAIVWSDMVKPNDPVTHRIREDFGKWHRVAGDKVSLIPEPLVAGTPKDAVIAQLAQAKYQPDADGAFAFTGMTKGDGLYYVMSATEGPCDVSYQVMVRFDAAGALVDAEGTETMGCL